MNVMNRVIRLCGFAFLLSLTILTVNVNTSKAQCAMCTLNAEQSVKDGNTQGKGLNKGILFLLAMPYIAVGTIGYLWYKKYRKKQADIGLTHDPVNLN